MKSRIKSIVSGIIISISACSVCLAGEGEKRVLRVLTVEEVVGCLRSHTSETEVINFFNEENLKEHAFEVIRKDFDYIEKYELEPELKRILEKAGLKGGTSLEKIRMTTEQLEKTGMTKEDLEKMVLAKTGMTKEELEKELETIILKTIGITKEHLETIVLVKIGLTKEELEKIVLAEIEKTKEVLEIEHLKKIVLEKIVLKTIGLETIGLNGKFLELILNSKLSPTTRKQIKDVRRRRINGRLNFLINFLGEEKFRDIMNVENVHDWLLNCIYEGLLGTGKRSDSRLLDVLEKSNEMDNLKNQYPEKYEKFVKPGVIRPESTKGAIDKVVKARKQGLKEKPLKVETDNVNALRLKNQDLGTGHETVTDSETEDEVDSKTEDENQEQGIAQDDQTDSETEDGNQKPVTFYKAVSDKGTDESVEFKKQDLGTAQDNLINIETEDEAVESKDQELKKLEDFLLAIDNGNLECVKNLLSELGDKIVDFIKLHHEALYEKISTAINTAVANKNIDIVIALLPVFINGADFMNQYLAVYWDALRLFVAEGDLNIVNELLPVFSKFNELNHIKFMSIYDCTLFNKKYAIDIATILINIWQGKKEVRIN